MKCTIVLQSICYFKTIFSSHTLVTGLGSRSIARHDNDNGLTPAMVCKSKGALCICISSPLCRFPFFLPQIYFIFVLLFLFLIGHYEQIATATIGICFTMGDTTKLCFSWIMINHGIFWGYHFFKMLKPQWILGLYNNPVFFSRESSWPGEEWTAAQRRAV